MTIDRVLLLQLDGSLPNLALMRLAAHFRSIGSEISYRRADCVSRVPAQFGERFDRVYASAIFSYSAPICRAVQEQWPGAFVGGTGWSVASKLEDCGIATVGGLDYSIYPEYRHSVGFTQRGCRLSCEFCVVPVKEGKVRAEHTIAEIWRGDAWPKNVVLLDNDFFGQKDWRSRIAEIRAGGFKVSFNQGINCRCLTDEAAEAVASVRYYDDDFKRRMVYTAWDSKKDEDRLFSGIGRLLKYGVKPDQITVYMLIGFWPGETDADWEYRRMRLRELGVRPYPMAYDRSNALQKGFQRFVIRRADLKGSWAKYKAAKCRPERVGMCDVELPSLFPMVANGEFAGWSSGKT